MRLDHRAEWQQIEKEPSEEGGQAVKHATNADAVDKPVKVKHETQPSDCELQACRFEVVATFIHFVGHPFELSETSSSKLCCSAPGALDANVGAVNEGGSRSSSFGLHAQNPRRWASQG